jgi:polysaccharide export outer membrane protein
MPKTMLLTVALATACAPSLPAAPTVAGTERGFESGRVHPPGLEHDPPRPFVLLPGDRLALRVLSVRPLEVAGVTVDPTGAIHVPMAGAVPVGGVSLEEAEQRVTEALRPYDRFGRVMLSIEEATGHRVSVVGAVNQPGSYPLQGETRLADLVAIAGGSSAVAADDEQVGLADLRGARLIRGGEALPVSLTRALEGDPLHNVRVDATDLLYVPPARSERISVLGEVGQPRSLRYREGMRLSEALARAGGTTTDADDADVRIVRGPLSEPRVYRAKLDELVAGQGTDVQLEPGDIVYVTQEWLATLGEVVGRLTPLLAAGAMVGAVSR